MRALSLILSTSAGLGRLAVAHGACPMRIVFDVQECAGCGCYKM